MIKLEKDIKYNNNMPMPVNRSRKHILIILKTGEAGGIMHTIVYQN